MIKRNWIVAGVAGLALVVLASDAFAGRHHRRRGGCCYDACSNPCAPVNPCQPAVQQSGCCGATSYQSTGVLHGDSGMVQGQPYTIQSDPTIAPTQPSDRSADLRSRPSGVPDLPAPPQQSPSDNSDQDKKDKDKKDQDKKDKDRESK